MALIKEFSNQTAIIIELKDHKSEAPIVQTYIFQQNNTWKQVGCEILLDSITKKITINLNNPMRLLVVVG